MASVSSVVTQMDMSADGAWDWKPTVGTATVIELKGPVYFGRVTGNFVISGTTVTGTALSFQYAKNGLSRLSSFPMSEDAATLATYFDIGDSLQSAFTFMFRGNDTFNGGFSDDIMRGYAGNDRLEGGDGRDTALYAGARANFSIERSGSYWRVTDNTGAEGVDTLFSVERLKFADATIAFDTSGNAGKAYRLYQAAFNRTPDQPGLGFQVKALDAGYSLPQVAQNFISSPEFSNTFGSLDNGQFVSQLYQNVLHRAADSAGLSYHSADLAKGTSRAQLLVNFSESPENQAALIGTIQNGMTYTS